MRRERSRQPLFVGATGGEHDEDYEILVGKINQTTSTAADVDSGKKFVDVNQDVVIGTSTYKADYIALNQSVNTINNNLESVITGSGSGGGLTVDQVKGLIDGTGTSFTIPEGTTSIDSYLFYKNSSLTTVNIPNSVTSIGKSVFGQSNIVSLTIPNSVTSVGSGAFSNCGKLNSITLPSGLASVPEECFYCCSKITSINIPDSVTTLGVQAFSGCKLTSVTLPSGLATIGSGAFANNTALTSITFPSTVETIGVGVFSYCYALEAVTFLGTPTSINTSAFSYANSLTTIYVPWSEGEVAGSPWGASSATIVYDHTA